ncbi:inhibitor of DNA binding 3, HLH protein [Turdus rufiventris]|nr:inhibitor of DNA binding 3, HLH protein [Turdus rufiventris]
MKAISPVRSVRSCYEAVCCLSEQSLAIARGSHNKSPALEEPMNLLYDMNDCYSKLRELVPGIPQGTKVTQVEILQHVIDYIFDLEIVLEEGSKGRDPSSEATLLSLKVRIASGRGLGGFFTLSGILLIPDLGMELAFPGENDGVKNNVGEEPRDRDKQGDGEEPRDEEEPTPVAWWPQRD